MASSTEKDNQMLDSMGYAALLNDNPKIDGLLRLLLALAQQNDTEYSTDFQQKLLDLVIGRSQLADERAYNEKWRDNERDYNSPAAMLSRLTALGMSRDAAFQLLHGGASASAAPSTSSLGLSPSNPSAIEQANLDLNRKAFVRDTILGTFQTAASLVGLGFSAKQSLSASTNLDVQSKLASLTIDGAQQGASVMQSITSLASSQGLSEKQLDEHLSTPSALRSWLSSMPDNPAAVQALQDYDASQRSVFGQRGFREAYDSYIAQRGYKYDTRDAEMRNKLQFAELALKDVSADQIREGINLAWQEFAVQLEKLGIDRDLANSQIEVNDELSRLTNAQFVAQDQQNSMHAAEVSAISDNYENLYQMHARDILMQFAAFESYYGVGSEKASQGYIDYIQRYWSNEQFKATAAAIAKMSADNTLNALIKRNNTPVLNALGNVLECMRLTGISSAMGDLFQAGIDTYKVTRPNRVFGKE